MSHQALQNLWKHCFHIGALGYYIFECSVHSHHKTQALPCLQSKYQKKKNAATNVEKKYRREPIQQKMKYERAKQLYGWCNF